MDATKKRKYTPTDWSWTSKVWKASELAKEATEQAQQVDILQEQLQCTTRQYSLMINEKERMAKCIEKQRVLIESLRADSVKKQEQILLLREEGRIKTNESNHRDKKIAELEKDHQNRITALEKKIYATERDCLDSRSRKKIWKKKY